MYIVWKGSVWKYDNNDNNNTKVFFSGVDVLTVHLVQFLMTHAQKMKYEDTHVRGTDIVLDFWLDDTVEFHKLDCATQIYTLYLRLNRDQLRKMLLAP